MKFCTRVVVKQKPCWLSWNIYSVILCNFFLWDGEYVDVK